MPKRSLASRGGMPGTMGPLQCKQENELLHWVLSHLFMLRESARKYILGGKGEGGGVVETICNTDIMP